jgi:hypothetical protein
VWRGALAVRTDSLGRLLLVKGGGRVQHWGLPGGGLEPNESFGINPRRTAVRRVPFAGTRSGTPLASTKAFFCDRADQTAQATGGRGCAVSLMRQGHGLFAERGVRRPGRRILQSHSLASQTTKWWKRKQPGKSRGAIRLVCRCMPSRR